GFDDPETKLDDVLQYLQRAYNIPFEVNDKAFKEAKIEAVREKAIGKAIPKMDGVPLDTVLQKFLNLIPSKSAPMWFVRSGVVELPTVRASRAEFYPERPSGPFPPLVLTTFEKKPLEDALRQLAEDTDANIVIDAGRAADKARTPVTARL